MPCSTRINLTLGAGVKQRFAMTHEALPAVSDPSIFRPVWPLVFVILGLGLTAAWTALLGYGLVQLVEMAL